MAATEFGKVDAKLSVGVHTVKQVVKHLICEQGLEEPVQAVVPQGFLEEGKIWPSVVSFLEFVVLKPKATLAQRHKVRRRRKHTSKANSMLSQAIVLFRLLSWACLRHIYGEKQALALVWGSREDAQMTEAVVGNQCCSFWVKGSRLLGFAGPKSNCSITADKKRTSPPGYIGEPPAPVFKVTVSPISRSFRPRLQGKWDLTQ